VTAPLRIGILGAARIADDGIVAPARALGHELVAVAARDRDRAAAFAAARGIARVHDSYAGLIADPDVDLVYNALVNSLHAEWNIAAPRAGKHVLSEKPLTSNADEARAVRAAARASSGCVAEGFHYRHHPVHLDNRLLVTTNGQTTEEVLGDQTSYTYQLAALAAALRGGPDFPAGIDGSVVNADLIDECYRRAGLAPRGT